LYILHWRHFCGDNTGPPSFTPRVQAASIYHYYYYYSQPCYSSVMDTTKRGGGYYCTRGPGHTVEIESDRFIPCELNPTPAIHHRIVSIVWHRTIFGVEIRPRYAHNSSSSTSSSPRAFIIYYYIILYSAIPRVGQQLRRRVESTGFVCTLGRGCAYIIDRASTQ